MKHDINKQESLIIKEFVETICNHGYNKIEEVESHNDYMGYVLDRAVVKKFCGIRKDILREKWKLEGKTMCEVASVTHQEIARKKRMYEAIIELTQAYLDNTIINLMQDFLKDYKEFKDKIL